MNLPVAASTNTVFTNIFFFYQHLFYQHLFYQHRFYQHRFYHFGPIDWSLRLLGDEDWRRQDRGQWHLDSGCDNVILVTPKIDFLGGKTKWTFFLRIFFSHFERHTDCFFKNKIITNTGNNTGTKSWQTTLLNLSNEKKFRLGCKSDDK